MHFSIFYKNKKRGLPAQSGFTLVELIVVMSITTVIMTTLVIQQDRWNDSLVVNTQSYELALTIRQAQIYALGVRENVNGSGDKFEVGYGVYFSSENSDAFKKYTFFGDVNKNGTYDDGIDNVIEIKPLTRGVVIDRFCGTVSGSEVCTGLNNISVSFFRPEPKANIIFSPPAFSPPASIYLRSPGNRYFRVRVEANGQVSTGPYTP